MITKIGEDMKRLGEILTVNIGDIEFDDLGARLRVEGKVGLDYGRVIASSSLFFYLDEHPSTQR